MLSAGHGIKAAYVGLLILIACGDDSLLRWHNIIQALSFLPRG